MTWDPWCFLVLGLCAASALERPCSKFDTIQIDVSTPEAKKPVALKTLHRVTRIESKLVETVKATRVTWTSVYCPAIEFGPFKDCQQQEGNVPLDQRDLEELQEKGRVSRPHLCNDGSCDGVEEEDCLNPKTYFLDAPPFYYQLSLSSSWIHHRCAREVSSETLEVDAIIRHEGPLISSLEVPGIGRCAFKASEGGCIVSSLWIILLPKNWVKKVSEVDFPCLEKGDEKLCYDKESRLQFLLRPGLCNVLGGVTFCSGAGDSEKQNQDIVKVVTPEVVYELSLQLEYENLESAFDFQIISEALKQTNSLVTSILLHSLGISSDPLQEYMGIGISEAYKNGSLIQGKVCQKSYSPAPRDVERPVEAFKRRLFDQVTRASDYEEMLIKVPFLRKVVHPRQTHFNLTKLKHGSAPVVNFVGFVDYFTPSWVKSVLWFVNHLLPVANSLVIVVLVLRRN
nr:glycoprotein [Aedes orthomyxo-like virus 2]